MTISSTENKVIYEGDSIEDTFTYTYRMDHDGDMEVYLDDVLQSSGYAVNRNPDNIGGSVLLSSSPATGMIVTLLRVIDFTQETDYEPYGPFPAESHEDALDKLTMLAQQQQEQIDRNTQAIGEDDGVDTQAPPFEANKAWKWSDGSPDKKIITSTYDPDEQVSLAEASANNASVSEGNAAVFASNSQLAAWVSEAEMMTADSYATEPHSNVVIIYTSNGDGTFTGTPTLPAEYSSLHWSIEASGAGGVPEAPVDAEHYVRGNTSWAIGVLKSVYEAAIALLAPLDSPALTGTPTAPTPVAGTDTTQVATTAFVKAEPIDTSQIVDGAVTKVKLNDAITSPNMAGATHVIKSGGTNNLTGHWVQYADGTMVQWGVTAGKLANTAWGSGGLYRNSTPDSVVFPIPFIGNLPAVTSRPSASSVGIVSSASFTKSSLTGVDLFFIADSNGTGAENEWAAIGRWK